MKFAVLFGVLLVTLFSYSSAEILDDLEKAEDADELLSLIEEQTRAKECTPRFSDCTNDSPQLLPRRIVQRCLHMLLRRNGGNEFCTCQQPKQLQVY
uniref:U11-Lycotoxin-Lsp1e_1 n=1 Tax=Lycosa sp. SGP-2016 TaxID=1905177 RepID=A0A482ZBS6_9ARAC